jgi:hypothetical protein
MGTSRSVVISMRLARRKRCRPEAHGESPPVDTERCQRPTGRGRPQTVGDVVAVAKHLQRPDAKVQAATNYAEAFPAEIERAISENAATDF